MKTINSILVAMVLALFMNAIALAVPPIPARIGGIVTIDETLLTDSTDEGYIVKVTKTNGDPFNPIAEDNDGLNTFDWYIIDIPIYDSDQQLGGAQPGEQAIIHVYLNGEELTLTNPVNGEYIIGDSGSTEQIDLEAKIESNNSPSAPQSIFPNNEQTCSRTTEKFIWGKSIDPDGDPITYKLQICEDENFAAGCITVDNIALINNKSIYYAGMASGLLLFGIVLVGSIGDKKRIMLILIMIIIAVALSTSCGNDPSPTCEHPNAPTIDPSSDISNEVSGLKSDTKYYWKVVAADGFGGTAKSEVRSFTTK